MRRALAVAGHPLSLGAAAPAETLVLADGPPLLRILVLPDRPGHDPALSTCNWDREAGEWVVAHREMVAMRTVLVERSRQHCRAQILARAPEEEQRNAALANGETASAMLAMIDAWRAAHAAHKAALESLDDADGLANYDLSVGWPEAE